MALVEPAAPGRRYPLWYRLITGLRRYWLSLLIEVAAFYLTLVAFQSLADARFTQSELLPIGPLLVVVGLAVGEAHERLYRRVWRVASLQDAIAVGIAVTEASLVVAILNLLLPPPLRPFRAVVPLLAAPAVAGVVGTIKLLPRLSSRAPRAENRLLIVAADDTAYSTVKTLIQVPNPLWSAVAILTNSDGDLEKRLLNVPVVGYAKDLAHWLDVTRADGVAFVLGNRQAAELRDLFTLCVSRGRPVFIVPGSGDWFARSANRFRQLTADDLVGRPERQPELELAAEKLAGATVAVTGAAGSIGAELARQLAALRVGRLVLIDNNESGLFDITEAIRASTAVEVREALVSVTDAERLQDILEQERPQFLFHAAAYKHVPMLERYPEQGVEVNVGGTRTAIRSATAAGVENFILISTDKAASCHSVLGCTKRLAELLVLNYDGPMRCWAVRFGNVVGSRGSVIPTFERQIEQGGPITITHPDVSRYLMTIREAVSLVLTTSGFAVTRRIYMLDMGEPIRILDLANSLVRARGLRPGADIEVIFTGLRPGEVLTETLMGPDEELHPTDHPFILELGSERPVVSSRVLEGGLDELLASARSATHEALMAGLKRLACGETGAVREASIEAIG